MIHLKYKCKVNFVKLPLIWICRCLKLIFENATAGRNTGCRSVVNRQANTNPPNHPSVEITAATKLAEYDPPAVTAVHTRACTGIKNAHNSVTIQNQTHVYMNFFHHKDLGNHLLQLCPKVVKHPVCVGQLLFTCFCKQWSNILFMLVTWTVTDVFPLFHWALCKEIKSACIMYQAHKVGVMCVAEHRELHERCVQEPLWGGHSGRLCEGAVLCGRLHICHWRHAGRVLWRHDSKQVWKVRAGCHAVMF